MPCLVLSLLTTSYQVKQYVNNDPRYSAVGSSSLREELFNTFLKANTSSPAVLIQDKSTEDASEQEPLEEGEEICRKQERRGNAVRQREEKVKAERGRVEADIGRSRMGLNKEEGELEFRCAQSYVSINSSCLVALTSCLSFNSQEYANRCNTRSTSTTFMISSSYVNQIQQVTWDAVLPQLKRDPRFSRSLLPKNQQANLFRSHVGQLRSKYLNTLYSLFEAEAPSFASSFSSFPASSLLSSQPVIKLGMDIDVLQREFEKWQRERTAQARKDFDEMLNENSFLNFWTRLRKIGGDGVDGGVEAEDMGEDEGEGGGGKVDMKVLAKSVDVEEIEAVLRVCTTVEVNLDAHWPCMLE
jgi:hypothetical protein